MNTQNTYLRKEHFSTTKEVTHLVHSSHQGTFNNSQIIFLLLLVQLYNFIHILVDIIGNALYQRVLNTLFNLCIILLQPRRILISLSMIRASPKGCWDSSVCFVFLPLSFFSIHPHIPTEPLVIARITSNVPVAFGCLFKTTSSTNLSKSLGISS